jgi:hypothetical protein
LNKLVHLNPTSIFWRYCAITTRRARLKTWDATDLVASNTAFWVEGNRRSGSELIMVGSRAYLTRQPEKGRASLLSEAGIKTFVVTLQGVQAIWEATYGFLAGLDFSLPTLFAPFATFGLLRLAAALWISDEGAYALIAYVLVWRGVE